MAERRTTQSDRITTTEGVREMVSQSDTPSHVEQVTPMQDEPAELTIIEPSPTGEVSEDGLISVDAIIKSLEHITTLSLELPNSDHLAKVLVHIHAAMADAETLKLHLQGFNV